MHSASLSSWWWYYSRGRIFVVSCLGVTHANNHVIFVMSIMKTWLLGTMPVLQFEVQIAALFHWLSLMQRVMRWIKIAMIEPTCHYLNHVREGWFGLRIFEAFVADVACAIALLEKGGLLLLYKWQVMIAASRMEGFDSLFRLRTTATNAVMIWWRVVVHKRKRLSVASMRGVGGRRTGYWLWRRSEEWHVPSGTWPLSAPSSTLLPYEWLIRPPRQEPGNRKKWNRWKGKGEEGRRKRGPSTWREREEVSFPWRNRRRRRHVILWVALPLYHGQSVGTTLRHPLCSNPWEILACHVIHISAHHSHRYSQRQWAREWQLSMSANWKNVARQRR